MRGEPWSLGEATWCALAAETLRSCGQLRLQVRGWSMFPSVRPGDRLMIERVDEARVGEIVLFRRDRRLCAHRVVGKRGTKILTRGDAMASPDPEVDGEELLGTVRFIVRDGRLLEAGKQRVAERAVGAMMARSGVAARVVAGWHTRRRAVGI